MIEPADYVQQGEQLCAEQLLADAERAFQLAIQAYEQAKDTRGEVYALGRLGFCYEQRGLADRAIVTYYRAINLGSDIPAIRNALTVLLARQGKLDEALVSAARWQDDRGEGGDAPAQLALVNVGAEFIREKRFDEAIALLSRTVEAIPVGRFPAAHWMVRGTLALALEKSGQTGTAMEMCAAAIRDGSQDPQTYTRYLMHLEHEKQYDLALRIIRQALKVALDAAWEADLRLRQQRIERKVGKIPKDAPAQVVPVFSVRRGAKAVALLRQIKFSPQLADLALGQSRVVYLVTGGQRPQVSAWHLDSGQMTWQVSLEESAHGIVFAQDSLVIYAQQGRVGDGATLLRFFDLAGKQLAARRLPDAPTDVVAAGGLVYAGCRDGRLYALSAQGQPLWAYEVPGSQGAQSESYSRPCPYNVAAAGDLVAFSSFSQVYALDRRGKLRWQWAAAERKETSTGGGLTFTISTGPAWVNGLALTPDGGRAVVTAADAIHEVVNGETVNQIRLKDKSLSRVTTDPTGGVWGVSADDQVLVFRDRRVVGRFAAGRGARLSINARAGRLLAAAGKKLVVATLAGKLVADIDFVKLISRAQCLDDGRAVVGAGHLVVLETTAQVAAPEEESAGGLGVDLARHSAGPKEAKALRPSEERGIPLRWVDGEKLEGGPGKAQYRGDRNQAITIEQLALERYRRQGYVGAWTENDYWSAIMSLLFWPVIFAKLPGVFTPGFGDFPSRMQDMPLDFFTTEFYPRRKALIEKRIAELTRPQMLGLRKPDIEAELRSAFGRYKATPCRPMDWTKYAVVDDLLAAPRILTGDQLMKIMRRLLENFGEHRSGLPDLFMAQEGRPLFAEVKSEREHVADHQFAWMNYLRTEVGAPVEICRVVAK